jgi:hypothetical protein
MKLFSVRKFQVESAAARLTLTDDAMASAGINCCSTVSQQKLRADLLLVLPSRVTDARQRGFVSFKLSLRRHA